MTAPRKAPKPKKPHRDFPLFAHASGKWAKKIHGRLHYFGSWDDPQGALEEYLEDKDDLIAGRERSRGRATIKTACDAWLKTKQRSLDLGKLQPCTYQRYERTANNICDVFGDNTDLNRLTEDHFFNWLKFMDERGWTPIVQHNEMINTQSMFLHAQRKGLRNRPIDYKAMEFWSMPSSEEIDEQIKSKDRLLPPGKLREAIFAAPGKPRIMILLGINAGLGNTDIARMPRTVVDLKTGWIDYRRTKTKKERRFKLWPETRTAIEEMLSCRKDKTDLLLLDGDGQTYDDGGRGFRIYTATKPYIKPYTFYDLRRTFITEADNACHDKDAIRLITGHKAKRADMLARYRQNFADERLKAVTDAVHAWLFGN